ncbi:MAG: DNA circularization N-terminal domain-containing protein [Oscillospiraceae bacterium]|nr:DNA circularization N-terminal domain-containing protein [Oscillospiraceae bacterium]
MQAMEYKDFTFPNNPKTVSLRYERYTAQNKVPMGASTTADLGRGCCIIEGEGEFFGEHAYQHFLRLAELFRHDGAGTLTHPVWGSMQALFTKLTLRQEPEKDYVSYAFAFQEVSALAPMEEVLRIEEVE